MRKWNWLLLSILAGYAAVLSIACFYYLHHFSDPIAAEAKAEALPKQVEVVEVVAIDKAAINKTLLEEYYRKSGSRSPKEMASAVLITKRPRLMAAMSVVESDGNYTVRNTGYKRRHSGAWQVNPYFWGEVPDDPKEQALQAQKILDTYLKKSKGDMTTALNKYGGCSRGLYSRSITKELQNVPDLML